MGFTINCPLPQTLFSFYKLEQKTVKTHLIKEQKIFFNLILKIRNFQIQIRE